MTNPTQKVSKISHVIPPIINPKIVNLNKLKNINHPITAAKHNNNIPQPNRSTTSNISPIISIVYLSITLTDKNSAVEPSITLLSLKLLDFDLTFPSTSEIFITF